MDYVFGAYLLELKESDKDQLWKRRFEPALLTVAPWA